MSAAGEGSQVSIQPRNGWVIVVYRSLPDNPYARQVEGIVGPYAVAADADSDAEQFRSLGRSVQIWTLRDAAAFRDAIQEQAR